MNADDRERLRRLGLPASEIRALGVMWRSERADLLLDYTFASMRDEGFGVADAYDAAVHWLPVHTAVMYFQAGFSGHQAATIEDDDQAKANLYGTTRRRSLDQVVSLLAMPVMREHTVNVLRAAKSPSEARRWLTNARNAVERGPAGAARLRALYDEAAMLAAFLKSPDLVCVCASTSD